MNLIEQKGSSTILLIDDDNLVLKSYEIVLKSNGFQDILSCNDSRKVLSIIKSAFPALIILDLSMPYVSGEELLPEIICHYPEIPILVITGNSEIDTAVNCMKHGAFDYIIKPIDEDRFLSSIKNALKRKVIENENRALKNQLMSGNFFKSESFSEVITNHPLMISIFKYIVAISNTQEPILVTGETGVGKELIAKAIHRESNVSGPLIPVNVSGIDDNAFTDSLFGHEKGAFTDAINKRKGLVEEAMGGTLFLDEIGDLTPASQIKLLRLLQEKEYRSLGSDKLKHSDVKIIAATSCDLKLHVKKGEFRKDLYYRLDVHHIHLPPLRERLSDIPLLVDHFLDDAAANFGRKDIAKPDELYSLLSNYSYPGNLRELRSIVFDAVSTCNGNTLTVEDFQLFNDSEKKGDPISDSDNVIFSFSESSFPTLQIAEKAMIEKALIKTRGNKMQAAALLGISRQTLLRKLKKSNL